MFYSLVEQSYNKLNIVYMIFVILYSYKSDVKLRGKKGQKQWQKNAYAEADDLIKKTLIQADGAMTKTHIHKATGLSRVTINKHLHELEYLTKQVVKIGKDYFWGDKYHALVKCLKEDAGLIEELEVLVNRLIVLIHKMSKPENVWRWKREAHVPLPDRIPFNIDADAPATITLMTDEEMKQFFNHREKVFGGLRCCFFDLAKVVMKVDVGLINAEEDLSNVMIRFRNGRAVWTVYPYERKDGL